LVSTVVLPIHDKEMRSSLFTVNAFNVLSTISTTLSTHTVSCRCSFHLNVSQGVSMCQRQRPRLRGTVTKTVDDDDRGRRLLESGLSFRGMVITTIHHNNLMYTLAKSIIGNLWKNLDNIEYRRHIRISSCSSVRTNISLCQSVHTIIVLDFR